MKTTSTIKVFDGANMRVIELYDDPADVAGIGQYAFAVQGENGVTLYGAMDRGNTSAQVLKCVDSQGTVHTVHKSVSEGPLLNYFYMSTQGLASQFTLDGNEGLRHIVAECKSGSRWGDHTREGGYNVQVTLAAHPKAGGNPLQDPTVYQMHGAGGGGGYFNGSASCTASRAGSTEECTCSGGSYTSSCRYRAHSCSCQTTSVTGGHGAKGSFALDLAQIFPSINLREYDFVVDIVFYRNSTQSGTNMACSTQRCVVGCHFNIGASCDCNASECNNTCTCSPGSTGLSYDGVNGGTSQTTYEACDVDPIEQLAQDIAFVKIYTM